ncbi:MAG: hypothetical protein V2I63_03380 [Pseudomonadales bacterium]|jgi:hypothetical protein|nr:hypothetical protein [Pseudomonadales bacterium]
MKRICTRKLTGLAVAVGLAFGGASVAHAEGTAAGTDITNQATLSFSVGGVPQTDIESNEATFEVDRLLDVDVTAQDAGGVVVSAGADGGDPVTDTPETANGAYLTFDVTNQGNDTVDLLLGVVRNGAYPFAPEPADGQTADAATLVGMCTTTDGTTCATPLVSEGGNGGTFRLPAVAPSELASPAPVQVLVFFDLPTSVPNNAVQWDAWSLVAAVTDPDNGNAYLATDSSADDDDPTLVQNVFGDEIGSDFYDFAADAAGTGPAARDGQHASVSAFIVNGSTLTVTKVSRVVRDPFGNAFTAGTDIDGVPTFSGPAGVPGTAKAVPGALVEYVITVENGDGSNPSAATAQSVTVTDAAPATTIGGDPDDASYDFVIIRACDGTDSSIAFSGVGAGFSAALGDCAPGEAGSVIFYVTVD